MHGTSRKYVWPAILLILTIGLIHLSDAQDGFEEAAYKGWLFYANGAGSLLAAIGIFRRRRWGWNLAFVIAAGSFIGYVLSRTIGLPLIPAEPDAWLEPLGIASLAAESALAVLIVATRRKESTLTV